MSISEKIQNRLRRALGIVSPSLTFMADRRTCRPLKIVFIGYDARQTARSFTQFAWDNAEQVGHFDQHRGHLILKDGTEVESMAHIDPRAMDGRRFDQVIIADDRRLKILGSRWDELRALDYCCRCSDVPEEYRYQFYDLDAEVQKDGV